MFVLFYLSYWLQHLYDTNDCSIEWITQYDHRCGAVGKGLPAVAKIGVGNGLHRLRKRDKCLYWSTDISDGESKLSL